MPGQTAGPNRNQTDWQDEDPWAGQNFRPYQAFNEFIMASPRWGSKNILPVVKLSRVWLCFVKVAPLPTFLSQTICPLKKNWGSGSCWAVAALWATHLSSLLGVCSFVGYFFGNVSFSKILRYYYSGNGNS